MQRDTTYYGHVLQPVSFQRLEYEGRAPPSQSYSLYPDPETRNPQILTGPDPETRSPHILTGNPEPEIPALLPKTCQIGIPRAQKRPWQVEVSSGILGIQLRLGKFLEVFAERTRVI